ncbi:hypothetical protein GW755_00655 [bacterium]|nr:hypothetical protein [bacterium]
MSEKRKPGIEIPTMADTARRVYGQEAADQGLNEIETEAHIKAGMIAYVERFVDYYDIRGQEKEAILGDPEACLDDPRNEDDFILMSFQ